MSVLVVTGTDTGVGKTVTTAALAVALAARGYSVAVDKPVQAGLDPTGDVDEVRRLSGISAVSEGIRLQAPMAPVASAAREGSALPTIEEHAARIDRLRTRHDHVLVEGSGGLLVELDGRGRTLADLAGKLGDAAPDLAVVVVCRATLGTLNHTALTLEALRSRRLTVAGAVIGAMPAEPDEIALDNQRTIARMAPLLGVIPAGAALLEPGEFRRRAPHWLATGSLLPS